MEMNIYKEVKKLIETNNIKDLRTFININNNLISKKDFIDIVQNYINNEIDAGLKIKEKDNILYFSYGSAYININDLKLKPYAFNILYNIDTSDNKQLLNILSMEKMHFIIKLLLSIEFKNIDVVNYIDYDNDINIVNFNIINYQNKVIDIINNMEIPQDIKNDIIKNIAKN